MESKIYELFKNHEPKLLGQADQITSETDPKEDGFANPPGPAPQQEVDRRLR